MNRIVALLSLIIVLVIEYVALAWCSERRYTKIKSKRPRLQNQKRYRCKAGTSLLTRRSERCYAQRELSVKYQKDMYDCRSVFVKFEDKKIHFREIGYMLTNEEWEQIMEILQPKETLYSKIFY
jgi:hypothetical protein